MKVVIFRTEEARARGLQFRATIEPDALFVFPDIPPGVVFHSRNVREPFDIAFLAADGAVLLGATVVPERQIVRAPAGTAMAVEARAGWLRHWGFLPGRKMQPLLLPA